MKFGEYFEKIRALEDSGASISFVTDDEGEEVVELMGPTQRNVQVMYVAVPHWNMYTDWKNSK